MSHAHLLHLAVVTYTAMNFQPVLPLLAILHKFDHNQVLFSSTIKVLPIKTPLYMLFVYCIMYVTLNSVL